MRYRSEFIRRYNKQYFRLKSVFLLIWVLLLLTITPEAIALNKVSNWDFNGSANGWTSSNNTGTNVCGNTSSSTETGFEAFSYDGAIGYSAGSFKSELNTSANNATRRGKITQQFTVPGSNTVKVNGSFDYLASGVSWNTTVNSSWIRLDVYDSSDSTYIGNLACVSFNANKAWTSEGLSSEVNLVGGSTYTLRLTTRIRNSATNGKTAIWVDNIELNMAPAGLVINTVAGSTNSQLSWLSSTAGSGALGLNTTNPYKVYRSASTGVSSIDFLDNSSSNAYTDSTTIGNTRYYYSVSDVDHGNTVSPLSAEAEILTRPGIPSNLYFDNISTGSLRIGWSDPIGGASSYKISRCAGFGCENFSQVADNINQNYFDDSGLIANTLYRYQVTGYNASGDGQQSAIAEQMTNMIFISVAVTSDGVVEYGLMAPNSLKNTTSSGLNDTQTIRNDGSVKQNFNIKSSNAIGGSGWTIGNDAGVDTFVHYYSANAGASWTKFIAPDLYQTLATGIPSGSSQNFDLQINTPVSSSDNVQKNITITIQALAE